MKIFHIVKLSPEALFDYKVCLKLGTPPIEDITEQLETFLSIKEQEGKRIDWYFRIKYFDDATEEMLMLFVKEHKKIINIKVWAVVGICLNEDLDEEAEYEGRNKAWYETKITDLTGEKDWVKEYGGYA